jgi:hypothetical protein
MMESRRSLARPHFEPLAGRAPSHGKPVSRKSDCSCVTILRHLFFAYVRFGSLADIWRSGVQIDTERRRRQFPNIITSSEACERSTSDRRCVILPVVASWRSIP